VTIELLVAKKRKKSFRKEEGDCIEHPQKERKRGTERKKRKRPSRKSRKRFRTALNFSSF